MDRVGDLEVDQDLPFERRERRAELVGRSFLALVVVVALLGAIGAGGPLAWADAKGESIDVSYDRFTRRGATTQLVVRVPADARAGSNFEVDIDRTYWSRFQVNAVTPQPADVTILPEVVRYAFAPEEGADLEATFTLTPRSVWNVDGDVSIPDGEPARFWQFLYP